MELPSTRNFYRCQLAVQSRWDAYATNSDGLLRNSVHAQVSSRGWHAEGMCHKLSRTRSLLTTWPMPTRQSEMKNSVLDITICRYINAASLEKSRRKSRPLSIQDCGTWKERRSDVAGPRQTGDVKSCARRIKMRNSMLQDTFGWLMTHVSMSHENNMANLKMASAMSSVITCGYLFLFYASFFQQTWSLLQARAHHMQTSKPTKNAFSLHRA